MSATNAAIQKKIFGSDSLSHTTALINLNEKKDIRYD